MCAMASHDAGEGHRPLLASVDGRDTVRVVLEHRGREHVGESTARTESDLAAASARATLAALDSLTPAAVHFRLDWCGMVEPAGLPRAVVVFATVSVAGVPMLQTGSALGRTDVQLAAVRATLDSMNRRLLVMGI